MTYSKTHQNFAINRNNQEALTNPENFLGPNWETVLNFWKWIDSLSKEQWKEVDLRYYRLNSRQQDRSWLASMNAADKTIGGYNRAYAYTATHQCLIFGKFAASFATWELIGMHLLLEQGKKLTFVPLFDGL